jgi:cell division protein FtsB
VRGERNIKKRIADLRSRLKQWFVPQHLLPAAALVIVLVLFGRDVLSSMKVSAEIRELRHRKVELERSIRADSTLLRRLEEPAFLERYAREHYLMRREGETVYVIED